MRPVCAPSRRIGGPGERNAWRAKRLRDVQGCGVVADNDLRAGDQAVELSQIWVLDRKLDITRVADRLDEHSVVDAGDDLQFEAVRVEPRYQCRDVICIPLLIAPARSGMQ